MNLNIYLKPLLRQSRHILHRNTQNVFNTRRCDMLIQKTYVHASVYRNYKLVDHTLNYSTINNNSSSTTIARCDKIFSISHFLEKNDSSLLNEEETLSLLKNCEDILHDTSLNIVQLHRLCEAIENSTFNYSLTHYHSFITVCTKSHYFFDVLKFLNNMKTKPDFLTYKLLLENACENGDVQQAVAVLNLLKENKFKVDEEIFNLLVLCHTIHGGLKASADVLTTMKIAHVSESVKTKMSIIRGTILNSNYRDFKDALKLHAFKLQDEELLQLLFDLGVSNNHGWAKEIVELHAQPDFSRKFIAEVEQLCLKLVNFKHPKSAIFFYELIILPSSPEQTYINELMERTFSVNTPPVVIEDLVSHLHKKYPELRILENTVEYALKNDHFDIALNLYNYLKPLRTHYFWPLLINAARKNGELGLFEMLKIMTTLGVKADAETFETYVLPLCDLSHPDGLLKQIQNMGYTVKELLTPFLSVLLTHRTPQEATKLCEAYNVSLNGEKLLKPLIRAWENSKDAKSVVVILQKIYETDTTNDFIGTFSIRALKKCRSLNDQNAFIGLLESMCKKQLRITSASAETLMYITTKRHASQIDKIQSLTDRLLDFSMKNNDVLIPHPRDMSLEQLECHLIELENKNMETRGVLRRLILLHSGQRNYERVKVLQQKLKENGYEESAGSKTATMYSYVKSGDLNLAIETYKEITSAHPRFTIDEFKIIDFATLMVSNNDFDSAMNLLESETKKRKVRGGQSIQRNCWRLLNAAKNSQQAVKLFNFIVDHGYCKVSNVLLGPLVRAYLNEDDLESATKFYVDCTNKYKCTPLQLELLCKVLESKDESLCQLALDATSKVHGAFSTKFALFVALAEIGMEKPIMNLLSSTTFPKKDLENACKKWITEEKLLPLETLAKIAKHTDRIDLSFLNLCIMQFYSSKNDCERALEFWSDLIDQEVFITADINKELFNLLKRCKYAIPDRLKAYGA